MTAWRRPRNSPRAASRSTPPIAAGAPALGILSANLPDTSTPAARPTSAACLATPPASSRQRISRSRRMRCRTDGRTATFETRRAIDVAGRQWAQFRTPVVFAQPGLQFVDVAVDGQGSVQRRRLFTSSAPRVLASAMIGGPRRSRLRDPGGPEGTSARTVRVDRGLRRRRDRRGAPASAFAAEALARIARAVSSRKTGLFLNGRHVGSSLSATTLMSHDETPLEPCCRSSARRAHGREARRRATS